MLFVKSILSTVSQLGRLGRRSEPPQPAADKSPAATTGTSSATSPPSDAMRQILAEYDVTNISPRAFSDMLQKLRQAGSLSEKDFQELSSIRLDLEHEGADPDQRVNLAERYAKKLSSIREQRDANPAAAAARQATQASLERQVEWLQKFAQLRSGTGQAGFDTLA
jgi:hypothetical protein